MIHATDGGVSQHFSTAQRSSLSGAKHVINAPVVDGSLACIGPQIAKMFQKISIRLAVVTGIVSEKIGLVSGAHLEIEVSRYKRKLAFGATTDPVNDVGSKRAST